MSRLSVACRGAAARLPSKASLNPCRHKRPHCADCRIDHLQCAPAPVAVNVSLAALTDRPFRPASSANSYPFLLHLEQETVIGFAAHRSYQACIATAGRLEPTAAGWLTGSRRPIAKPRSSIWMTLVLLRQELAVRVVAPDQSQGDRGRWTASNPAFRARNQSQASCRSRIIEGK